jgi:hypothetical protein
MQLKMFASILFLFTNLAAHICAHKPTIYKYKVTVCTAAGIFWKVESLSAGKKFTAFHGN